MHKAEYLVAFVVVIGMTPSVTMAGKRNTETLITSLLASEWIKALKYSKFLKINPKSPSPS